MLSHFSHVQLFATPWTVAHQAPPSMGFSRQEYWSGLPFPSPGDLPDPGIEPRSLALQMDSLPAEQPGKPTKSIQVQSYLSVSKDNSLQPDGLYVADLAPPSMGFSRQECWSGLPFPSPSAQPRNRTAGLPHCR